jgi:hypothetical protein
VLPRTISRWLALGLPARLRRAIDLPVTQVTAHALQQPAPVPAREPIAA